MINNKNEEFYWIEFLSINDDDFYRYAISVMQEKVLQMDKEIEKRKEEQEKEQIKKEIAKYQELKEMFN